MKDTINLDIKGNVLFVPVQNFSRNGTKTWLSYVKLDGQYTEDSKSCLSAQQRQVKSFHLNSALFIIDKKNDMRVERQLLNIVYQKSIYNQNSDLVNIFITEDINNCRVYLSFNHEPD